jgi:hypothetical protein
METKHYLALIILIALTCGSVLVQLLSQRMRDLAFFVLVSCSVLTERMDVNFLGEYWYRGTSRGMELSVIDTIAWGLLLATLIAPRYERRKWVWPAGTVFILLYFAWAALSIFEASQKRFAVWELVNIPRALLVMFAAAMFVRTQRELRILVLGLCTAVVIEGLFGLKQHFSDGIYRVPGTLDHPNSLSMYLCTVGPVLLAGALSDWPKWLRWLASLTCAAAGIGVLLTISRAGIPIFAFVTLGVALACTHWRITRRKVAIVATTTLLVGAVVFKGWDQIKMRYESASFSEEYLEVNGENRGVYWRWALMIVEDHPYGIGLNNWSYIVSKTYGFKLGFWYEDYDDIKTSPEKADLPSITYAPPAHSLTALTLGELGWPGLFLFLLMWFRWFHMGSTFLWRRLNSDPMHRLGIGLMFGTLGLFFQSATEWTYRQPTMLLTCHVMVGALASLYYARQHAPKPVRVAAPEPEVDPVPIETAPISLES